MNIYLILSMILVLTGNVILAVCSLQFTKHTGKQILRSAGILLVCELILLYALDFILFRFTLYDQSFAPLLVFALTELAFSAAVLLAGKGESRRSRFLCSAAGMICLSLLAELVIFCGKCYSTEPVSETRTPAQAGAELLQDAAVFEGSDILVSGYTEINFPLDAQDVQYVQLALESEDTFYQTYCQIADDNFSLNAQDAQRLWMNPSQKTVTFAIRPHGTLYDLVVGFRDVDDGKTIRITEITTMNVKPYSFSVLRFLALAGILVLIAAIRIFEWYKITYNRRKLIHCEAIAAVLLLFIGGVLAVCPLEEAKLIEYNMETGVSSYDPYALTFDAWQRGQLNLNVETDPLLAELENPYDRSARDASGAKVEWDKAFYDGKYYSYFGIAPVFFVYYPLYLTTGKLPTTELASVILSVLSMIFLFMLVLTLIRKYNKRVNFLLLLCGLAAAAASSGIYLCAHWADRYYVAITSGIFFLYLFLWLGLRATMAKRQLGRCLYLAGCGLGIAAAVLSRPPLALYAVLLIPPFLQMIRRKQLNLQQKAVSVTSFAIPVLIGAVVTMAYNAARFSSPLDFGSAYQLTVSNTAANIVSLSEFPAAMVHYFFHPVAFGGVFPFATENIAKFAGTAHYVYITTGYGAFMFLCIPVGFLLVGAVTGKKLCRAEKRWVFRLAFLMPVLMAFLDFCMGGYNTRYLCDILPVLAVFSVVVILDAQRQLRTVPAACGTFSRAAAVIFLTAPVFVLAMFLSLGEGFTAWERFPELYFDLRDLVVFWR